MSYISNYIAELNDKNRKALSIFLTVGFPDKENFVDLVLDTLDAGADLLELGIPFSDPIADGPVIQQSSQLALENGITLGDVFDIASQIKNHSTKPLILMGYANPILHYGMDDFTKSAKDSCVDGLIIPDIPLEELNNFWETGPEGLDQILLTTPTSPAERIKKIDRQSEGFVYCVSVTGTTGMQQNFGDDTLDNLHRTYRLIEKNKMLIGFGISTPEDINNFHPYCDGVIVGSAVINHLLQESNNSYTHTIDFIKSLSDACEL
jgi:tryptophan synthase alpha chain